MVSVFFVRDLTDSASLYHGSYWRFDTMILSSTKRMSMIKVLDTLLRHYRECLYPELMPPDIVFLHHLLHPKAKLRLQESKTRIESRFQTHTLKPYRKISKSKSNGSIQKGISAQGSANCNNHSTGNSSQRKTTKKEISEPCRPANTHCGPRRATSALDSFLGIGPFNLERNANC